MKDPNSNRINGLLLHNRTPVTLYEKFPNISRYSQNFELKGELLKMITIKNSNVDLAKLLHQKLMFDFAKEMQFDVNAQGIKSNRVRTLSILLKSPGLMVSASGISTRF